MAAVTRQCFVAGPSPKRARASSQGQAMLSPVDLNIQAVVKILRWRLQQGGTPSSLEQLESDFFDWWGVRFNPAIVKEPDFATFLRNRPDKFEVYSLEGVTKVRLSAQVVEKIREKIREGLRGGTARAAPSPRRRASEDTSLLPFVASSSRPEGRSAPSCARTSTAAGSVQSKPTAPAAELVPCPRWVAASALPKPPAASSSTPQSSAPSEAAKAMSPKDVQEQTTASSLQVGERGRPRHVVLTLRRRTGPAPGRSSVDDLQPGTSASPESIGQTTHRKSTEAAARKSASSEPTGQTSHRKSTGLSSCPSEAEPIFFGSGQRAARSAVYCAAASQNASRLARFQARARVWVWARGDRHDAV